MEITRPKLASLGILAIFAITGGVRHGAPLAIGSIFMGLLPLLLIWFPDELGSYVGPAGRGHAIDMESPGWAVAGLGWIFMAGLGLVAFFK